MIEVSKNIETEINMTTFGNRTFLNLGLVKLNYETSGKQNSEHK